MPRYILYYFIIIVTSLTSRMALSKCQCHNSKKHLGIFPIIHTFEIPTKVKKNQKILQKFFFGNGIKSNNNVKEAKKLCLYKGKGEFRLCLAEELNSCCGRSCAERLDGKPVWIEGSSKGLWIKIKKCDLGHG